MNIDSLTIGQVKEISKMACGVNGTQKESGIRSMLGEFVIVRTWAAGVHFGTLKAKDGNEVILADARRIWSWSGANTLNEISQNGIASSSKISDPVPEIWLEAIEIIPCSAKAKEALTAGGWSK